MSAPWRALLLNGSGRPRAEASDGAAPRFLRGRPRGAGLRCSTSDVLGSYLVDRLAELGVPGETLRVYQCLRSDELRRAMTAAVRDANLLVLCFPLFWDSLPAALTRSLELILEDRRSKPPSGPQRLAAVVNCGFPEARQCETALGICRQFARESGMVWLGGLALGGGGAISGRRLETLGRRTRHIAQALDLTAAAFVAGQEVPPAAVRLMVRPLVPPVLYRLFGNLAWRRHARAFGVSRRLDDRPYER